MASSPPLFLWLVGRPSSCEQRQLCLHRWKSWFSVLICELIGPCSTGSCLSWKVCLLAPRYINNPSTWTEMQKQPKYEPYRRQGRRKKKPDRIHCGQDYALNSRPIPCPIYPLATIRRSVTRPDWKWLFFQTLLKCVCRSNYFTAPDQVGASSVFSVKSFHIFSFPLFFISKVSPIGSSKYLWDLTSAGFLLGVGTANSFCWGSGLILHLKEYLVKEICKNHPYVCALPCSFTLV